MVQAVYHVWAASRLGAPFTVSVPTGNFGNVLAADVARRMGAPITRLAVGNNANHGLADLIRTGRLHRSEVIPTLAPAMDIQVPSNLERLLFELVDRDPGRVSELLAMSRASGELVLDEVTHARVTQVFSASWLDDAGIEETIRRVHRETGLVIDPHTATGWNAEADGPLVSVATAHPAKFPEAVEAAIGIQPGLPDDLADLLVRTERTEVIPAELAAVVELLGR
jgi:threonine synthase